jgi:NADH:ubiquinone oxidoreductase subunit F (NADH-binding)
MERVSAMSCGKDTLCREGSLQIRAILADVSAGKGREDDTELLRELLEVISENANCDTARTAAEKILSLMNAYGEQWDGHIFGKRCAARVCAALVPAGGFASAGAAGAAGPGRRRKKHV